MSKYDVLKGLKQVPFNPGGSPDYTPSSFRIPDRTEEPLRPIFQPPPALADQAPIYCQDCRRWWQVDPADLDCWRCRECNRLAVYAVQPGRCQRCDRMVLMLREAHKIRSLCLCHLSPEEHRELTRMRDRELDRQRRQQEAENERQRAWEQSARARATAAKCWDAKQHQCEVKRNAPIMEECRHCPRWTT